MANKQVKKTPRLVVKDSDPAQAEAYRKKMQMKKIGEDKVRMVFGELDEDQREDLVNVIQRLYGKKGKTPKYLGNSEIFSKEVTEGIAEHMHDRSKGRTEEQQLESEKKRPTNFKATMLKAAKARSRNKAPKHKYK
tara:strand:- start:1885 stop:2292 length:408 start_codon:yes stop_codon:yes gene_type:complete